MTSLVFSYSHKDEDLRDRLEVHLATLKRQGVIEAWHDRRIVAGEEIDRAIGAQFEVANLILLLVSPDFLASDYCYDVEVTHAMERHEAGSARVIPVILRACDWRDAPFGKLLATPRDGRPITKWPDLDEAFLDVARAIREAAGVPRPGTVVAPSSVKLAKVSPPIANEPRTSNLRVRKNFTDADRDRFLEKAFEYLARFFENSLTELAARNLGIETSYMRIDATQFTAVVYRDGKTKSRCKIRCGGSHGFSSGITYSSSDSAQDNSYNESLSVETDEQGMFLRPLGLAQSGAAERAHFAFEGAAEYYWDILVAPLQR